MQNQYATPEKNGTKEYLCEILQICEKMEKNFNITF